MKIEVELTSIIERDVVLYCFTLSLQIIEKRSHLA